MFEKNIKAIKEKNPQLAEKLEKIDVDSIEGITVAEAENEDLILGYKNIALHSTVDPIREARVIWNKTIQAELKKNDIQVVFGLGLGYLFKRAYLNANSKVFLFEPYAELLRFVLQHVDLSAELSDERVYITDNIKDIADKLRKEYLQGDRAEFLYLPAYASLATETLEELTGKIMEIVEEKSSDINTVFKFAIYWNENVIKNMPYLLNSVSLGALKDKFSGKTALIIGAGPSLAENIEQIKQNKDKFVTIAAGKAFNVLVENGITPDFVTFADATSAKKQLNGTEKHVENTNIIVSPRSDNYAVSLNAKNKVPYLSETDPFSNLFYKHSSFEPGVISSASSVSITNYFIAKSLGFSTIAFSGLDLAFPDNKIYATGEELKLDENGYIEMKTPSRGRTVKYTKDRNGREIATRDDYLLFIRQFEEVLEEETGLVRVINTSTRGAYINGMNYAEFDEFVKDLPEQQVAVDDTLTEAHSRTKNDWNSCIQKVFDEIYRNKNEINEIKNESELILSNINKLLEKTETEVFDNFNESEFSEIMHAPIELRKKVMNNLVLSTTLQGELWSYTKNYKTENLLNKEVLINNLTQEKQLLSKINNYSERLLVHLQNSSESMAEITSV